MSTMTIAPRHISAPRSAGRPSQVRLTRRGRAVVFLFAFAVVLALAVAIAAGSAATREDGGAPAVDVVTVAPGETLWDIASDVAAAGGGDVRGAMADIQDLNTLDGSVVYAGQQLRIPAAQ